MTIDWGKLPLTWEKYEGELIGEWSKSDVRVLKPGEILKLRDGRMVLVGDVNGLLGVCDDCTDFGREDIVEVANIWGLILAGQAGQEGKEKENKTA